MLLKIAWRNIWRNKVRSLVVIASVTAGLFAGMFMMSFFKGIIKQEIESAVETQLSHIQFHDAKFPDEKDVNAIIVNGNNIADKLRKNINVKAISCRVITSGMISSSSSASGVEIRGINPSDEKSVSTISKYITEGVYFSSDKKNEVVIGKKLAEKLGLKLHNKLVLTFQSKSGELTSGSFRIAGIFHSRNSSFDESTVFTQFGDLSQLLGTGNGIHEIAVMLNKSENAESVNIEFRKQFPNLLVQPWNELSPEMAMLTGLFDQMMYIIIGIILLALMFGIINTMLMAVLERQREFGMLMAIGMNKPRVFFMILFESVILTCVGLPVGIFLTIGTVGYFNKHGIDLSAFSEALERIGFSTMVYPEMDSSMLFPITIMTMITAVLSAIYPAIKAIQFKPAVAIHKI